MSRTILHIDLNNFYASVACLYQPELRDKPVAVCGNVEARHGIILAKNYPAKKLGIKTGEAIWEAKQKCPELILVPPDFKKYLRFSRMARKIYSDYTDQIESFGIDEAWIDVTGSKQFGSGETIANEIRRRFRDELGLTGSVGVSFNKIFAKLGSDMKKPDATTVISRGNFKDKVWPLPVEDLLYVGRSTKRKLYGRAIYTIGDLANRDVESLQLLLGVWGTTLWSFANGLDIAPVRHQGEETIIKSVGNSTTTHRDLVDLQDVKLIIYVLSESVAARLRAQNLKCSTIAIHVRSKDLTSFDRQRKLDKATYISSDIARAAIQIFNDHYRWNQPIRSIGVRGADLVSAHGHVQLDLFAGDNLNLEMLEKAVDGLRRRFGHYSIQRCAMLLDDKLTGFSPKDDHVIHPVSYTR